MPGGATLTGITHYVTAENAGGGQQCCLRSTLDGIRGTACSIRSTPQYRSILHNRSHNMLVVLLIKCKKRRPPVKTINFIIDALDPC